MILCAVALLALSMIGIYAVSAEKEDVSTSIDSEGRGFFAMRGWRLPFGRVMRNLTEEQRNELASEIQDLISSKLDEWGIEPPEPFLTEEQRSELKAGIEGLRKAGATMEEIREFIDGKLEELGVELPENLGRFQRGFSFSPRKPMGPMRRGNNNDTS